MWALIRDITERKRLENQLRESQKMEGIGQLAGGVAHDFNNILTAMTIQINLAKSDPNLTAELREVFKELSDGTERAANLTRQLLMFGRRSVMEIKVLDLNRLVANLIKMLERIIGEQVNLRLDCLGKTPPIEADAGMIEQVLVNLTVNARDAMPLGGRISIMTEFRQINEEQARTDSNRRTGDFVCLSVVDTGCGMDEPTKKRIFEPFFTTKEAGKGTGLGLATVYGIVTQHKGWIEVESQPGKGTRFDIFLPASTQSVTPNLCDPKPEGVPRGSETILLVEDEPAVRKMIGQFLTRLGYQVLNARNGLEAKKIWEEKWSVINLLFSDMIMPEGLNGLDLALDFRKQKPGLKVIISSGYSPETTRQGKPDEGVTFLPKPFQPSNLGVVVRECLDKE
jgi:nitrogen-specific signal transduction histidine kinase